MKYPPGTIVRLLNDVVLYSQDPSSDLLEGETGILVGEDELVFDPANPENSREVLYLCLVGGEVQHLFEQDFEPIAMEIIEA